MLFNEHWRSREDSNEKKLLCNLLSECLGDDSVSVQSVHNNFSSSTIVGDNL